jgi:anti-sigma regulatory factor (Ser/Thr protein kinase)
MPTPLHPTAVHFAIFTPYRAEKNSTNKGRLIAILHQFSANFDLNERRNTTICLCVALICIFTLLF